MKHKELRVKHEHKYKTTTDSKHHLSAAEYILDRRFQPKSKNQEWDADITYFWPHEGWLYLAAIINLYLRPVVGWCIDKRMTKSLVIRALMMTINPWRPSSGLIYHSYLGSQYASRLY
jgi:putative transposase